MKRKVQILCLLAFALLAFAVGANAERYITNGSYTAYVGENDYTYLEDPTGVTKVLHRHAPVLSDHGWPAVRY